MLSPAQRQRLLQRIREIGSDHVLTDIHVHPFEVLFRGLAYHPAPGQEGVYSASGSYRPPDREGSEASPGRVAGENAGGKNREAMPEPWRSRALTLSLRRLYAHTGPKVFADRMALSGIGRAVLLPVASAAGGDEDQLNRMAGMFGGDERFVLGCCVPADVAPDRIEETVRRAVRAHRARVIKIHPDLSGIDAGSPAGKERIEGILDAARLNRCPVIVHGGRSSAPTARGAADGATLAKLSRIDWSIAAEPVIIAHAGAFGCAMDEVECSLYPLLHRMLEKHRNLLVDLSGLGPEPMRFLLGKVDSARVLFGSDALYFDQSASIAALWHALEAIFPNHQEVFLQIAGTNPRLTFRKGENHHAAAAENQVLPVC